MLSYSKIMVPIDFAKISESAIAKAASHSEASNSQLLVVYVLDPESHNESDWANSQARAAVLHKAGQRVDELLDRLEIGYCDKVVKIGDTVEQLLEIIQSEKIDLVVMGTHSKQETPGLVKSITAAVVSNTECDVLVLHK